jgi:hypothetical protein
LANSERKKQSGPSQTPAQRQARGLRRVEFWWPADLVTELDEDAAACGVSRSEMVKRLIELAAVKP